MIIIFIVYSFLLMSVAFCHRIKQQSTLTSEFCWCVFNPSISYQHLLSMSYCIMMNNSCNFLPIMLVFFFVLLSWLTVVRLTAFSRLVCCVFYLVFFLIFMLMSGRFRSMVCLLVFIMSCFSSFLSFCSVLFLSFFRFFFSYLSSFLGLFFVLSCFIFLRILFGFLFRVLGFLFRVLGFLLGNLLCLVFLFRWYYVKKKDS